MKKILVAASALMAASAVPAAAQYPSYPDERLEIVERRLEELRFLIDDGVRRGRIGREEAYSLHDELAHLRSLEAHYRRGGLSGWERGDLQRRLVLLRDRIRYTESYGWRGADPRDDGPFGWDDRDGPGYEDVQADERAEEWNEEAPNEQRGADAWQDPSAAPDDRAPQDEGIVSDLPSQGGPDDNSWDDGDWQPEEPDEDDGVDDSEFEPI